MDRLRMTCVREADPFVPAWSAGRRGRRAAVGGVGRSVAHRRRCRRAGRTRAHDRRGGEVPRRTGCRAGGHGGCARRRAARRARRARRTRAVRHDQLRRSVSAVAVRRRMDRRLAGPPGRPRVDPGVAGHRRIGGDRRDRPCTRTVATAGRASRSWWSERSRSAWPAPPWEQVDDRARCALTSLGAAPPRPVETALVVNLASLWAGPLAADVLARSGLG